MTVHAVGFHTAVKIDDMIPGKGVVVVCSGTEVPAGHRIVLTLIDTSFRKYRDRKGIDVVRVGVEEWIVLPDGGSSHLPVRHSLVGVVENMVL